MNELELQVFRGHDTASMNVPGLRSSRPICSTGFLELGMILGESRSCAGSHLILSTHTAKTIPAFNPPVRPQRLALKIPRCPTRTIMAREVTSSKRMRNVVLMDWKSLKAKPYDTVKPRSYLPVIHHNPCCIASVTLRFLVFNCMEMFLRTHTRIRTRFTLITRTKLMTIHDTFRSSPLSAPLVGLRHSILPYTVCNGTISAIPFTLGRVLEAKTRKMELRKEGICQIGWE